MHAGILVFDDDEQGLCEMCERETVLTFHHLVPKQIHATVLKRALSLQQLGLPPPIDGAADDRGLPLGGMKEFLADHGSWLCRPCHSAVHRFADNSTLVWPPVPELIYNIYII